MLKSLLWQPLFHVYLARRLQPTSKRPGLGSVAIATIGLVTTPCLAQDQGCTEALARGHQVLNARYGPVVEGVELAGIEDWENTSHHPGSQQLAFVVRSKPGGTNDRTIAAHSHALMANQSIQASISRSIVKACPTIDVVSYRFEDPDDAVSHSRQSDGLIRSWSSETLANNPILLMP